jgi:hypothetical protein
LSTTKPNTVLFVKVTVEMWNILQTILYF